jgi:hypothetical protein
VCFKTCGTLFILRKNFGGWRREKVEEKREETVDRRKVKRIEEKRGYRRAE